MTTQKQRRVIQRGRTKSKAIAKAAVGAVVGGMVAGPVGAVAGAAAGALVEKGPPKPPPHKSPNPVRPTDDLEPSPTPPDERNGPGLPGRANTRAKPAGRC